MVIKITNYLFFLSHNIFFAFIMGVHAFVLASFIREVRLFPVSILSEFIPRIPAAFCEVPVVTFLAPAAAVVALIAVAAVVIVTVELVLELLWNPAAAERFACGSDVIRTFAGFLRIYDFEPIGGFK